MKNCFQYQHPKTCDFFSQEGVVTNYMQSSKSMQAYFSNITKSTILYFTRLNQYFSIVSQIKYITNNLKDHFCFLGALPHSSSLHVSVTERLNQANSIST